MKKEIKKEKLKKYILTEYDKNDLPLFLEDFNNLEEVKNYIEKRENKKISLSSLKHRKINLDSMILNKYYITIEN